MYTPLEEAKEEVWQRWNDLDLKRRVMAFVEDFPEGLVEEPRAVLYRQLITPNFELYRFAKISDNTSFKPLCLEYKGDKFCTRNPDKVLLGKMIFHNGTGKNGGVKTAQSKIIHFNDSNMKRFKEMKTVWGEDFIAFHHRIMSTEFEHIQITDNTAWFRKMGPKPSAYYYRFLSFFICNGILFENFLLEGDEAEFTRKIVKPAFEWVKNHFGIKPLIVRLLPEESEGDPYWCWYPGYLEAEIQQLIATGVANGHPAKIAGL